MVYHKYGGSDSRFTPQQLRIIDKREKEEKLRQQESEKKRESKENTEDKASE